jgi:hypothetical protein
MWRALFALQALIVGAAGAALWLPLPPSLVEQYYADALYPGLQARLTAWSNTTGVSLFDALIAVLLVIAVFGWIRGIQRARRTRSMRPLGRGVMATVVAASALYLWFAVAWGFNYARVPLETAIGYEPERVTAAALRALAERSVIEINRTYSAAHAEGFPQPGDTPAALATALHGVEQRLGRPRPTVPGRPKQTLLAPFFRTAGVDGMHAPFLLETLLNPDLTPPERPAVLAHEWAHMAGYAPEDDASFVGLVAAMHADAPSRYSAWLAVFDHAVGILPRAEQQAFLVALDPGPRADRAAIARRLNARVEIVARASWQTYDRYLKAQGVREGVQSYGRVVQLLLGSGAVDWP